MSEEKKVTVSAEKSLEGFRKVGVVNLEGLTGNLAAFVTVTSSTANSVIISASAELTRRMAEQIKEIEKERDAVGSSK